MSDLPPAIPAATLVLMQGQADGPPKLLMMERTGHMAFAAGAVVFPGGRVDAGDVEAAAGYPDLADAAARIAAIRETIEETGIAAGVDTAPDHALVRKRLEAGESLSDVLQALGLTLRLDALVPFARWLPNLPEPRRFDATFYLAEAPAGAPEPTAQAGEAQRVFWATADETLVEVDAGRARAIFPTRRNLERLARFASFAEARADAEAHPVRTITPWIEQRGRQDWLCIPEDAGYPVTAELLANARRG